MSLRLSFILVFSALLTALAIFASAFSYYSARSEAWSILDFQLQQISRIVGDGSGIESAESAGGASDEVVAIRIGYTDGREPVTNDVSVRFPDAPMAGLSTFMSNQVEWRVYTYRGRGRTVMVAQRTVERDELAADAAWNSAWPFLVAVPLSWMAAYWLVGAIMERLQSIAVKVETLSVEDTEPLPIADAPLEVRPLIAAINRAFNRVRETLDQQRAFLADAAHELRTPVTALSLQIGNLRHAMTVSDREAAIIELEAGVNRAAQVATQLLRLARSESGGIDGRTGAVTEASLAVQECLGRLLPLADAKSIDIGVVRYEPCVVRIDAAELATILDTILENALRYTPEGGQVDLAVLRENQIAIVTVTDNGPGIPKHLKGRVFDRFFRVDSSAVEGSGLGLAIARNLVSRNGGTISLEDNPAGLGLRVALTFPSLESPPLSLS